MYSTWVFTLRNEAAAISLAWPTKHTHFHYCSDSTYIHILLVVSQSFLLTRISFSSLELLDGRRLTRYPLPPRDHLARVQMAALVDSLGCVGSWCEGELEKRVQLKVVLSLSKFCKACRRACRVFSGDSGLTPLPTPLKSLVNGV